jgi:AcrR family transcriptional regulator
MPERLDRDDWVRAALDAFEAGGPAAVAIVPLAKALGVTRGSFYWHFDSRDELLVAALALWEREHSEEVLAAAEQITDPRERLRALFARANAKPPSIFVQLLRASDDPLVAPVLERVAERRLAVLARAYCQAGLGRERAEHEALLAYAAYMGRAFAPEGRVTAAYARHLAERLVP